MKLEYAGTEVIAASPEYVWERLLDHDLVASCAPGVENVEPLDETHFKVTAGLGVGKIRLRFVLDVELSDLARPHSASLRVHGKAPGSAVEVESAVRLTPGEDGHTSLDWRAESHVHGKVAGVGARLLKGTTQKLTADFWQKFSRQVGADA